MKFVPSSREDISRYYRGTYVKFTEYGDELFYIEGVDSQKVMGRHESGDPFILYLDESTPYNVEYILPHKSFFQLGNSAVQLQRIPAKMYHRGLCEANTQLVQWVNGARGVQSIGISFDNLKKFVSKQPFFTLLQAINAAEHITCALSSRMMYKRSMKEICIDFIPIAKVNPGKLSITMTKPVFMDEIRDFLKHSGELNTFKVELYTPPPPKEKTKPSDLLKEMGQKAAIFNIED